MLQNRLYRGEIVHKGQSHPGEHPAIIDPPLWDAVQGQLGSNTADAQVGASLGTNTLATAKIVGRYGREIKLAASIISYPADHAGTESSQTRRWRRQS